MARAPDPSPPRHWLALTPADTGKRDGKLREIARRMVRLEQGKIAEDAQVSAG